MRVCGLDLIPAGGPLMKPETLKAFRPFSIFTFKDLRSCAMRSGKVCHVPGAPMGTLRIHWSGDAMRSSWCLATSVNSHGSSVRATRPREPKALIHGRTISASHAGLARQWVSHLDQRMRSALSSATVRHFIRRPLARLSLAKSTLHTSLTVRSICRGMRCEIGRFTFLRRHTVRLWVETLPRSPSCE